MIVGLTLHARWLKSQFLVIFIGVNTTFFRYIFLGYQVYLDGTLTTPILYIIEM
jgi:heme/copper-type cytochrome/quinol oxidase subunit 1